jgi:hypothetical protein
MMNELYSEGLLETADLRALERLFEIRNAIVHGFEPTAIDTHDSAFLLNVARTVLAEAGVTRKIA